jgi:hypothetical protein
VWDGVGFGRQGLVPVTFVFFFRNCTLVDHCTNVDAVGRLGRKGTWWGGHSADALSTKAGHCTDVAVGTRLLKSSAAWIFPGAQPETYKSR